MKSVKLDARLACAYDYIRPGATVADVGTDHALLPIALLQGGRVCRAVASDINRGPLEAAARNLEAAGLSGKVDLVLSDGLHGIEQFTPTDIVIFGMGGEMIVRILAEAPWVKNPAIRLILQPMTHPEIVRSWLCAQGFAIPEESLCETDRVFQVLTAAYDGKVRALSPPALLLGEGIIKRGGAIFSRYVAKQIRIYEIRKTGKDAGGQDCAEEDAMLAALKGMLS